MLIVLHIGVIKTGSTHIQRVLHVNSQLLLKAGLFYKTNTPDEYNHSSTFMLLDDRSQYGLVRDVLQSNVREAVEAGCHTCIFSSENLVNVIVDSAFFREVFSGHSLKIVAYMRRPDELFSSTYAQMVTQENTKWPRFITERPHPYDPSYRTSIGRWIQNFGPEELVIAPFDRAQFKNDDLIADFMSMVGECDYQAFHRSFADPESNVGLPESLIEVVRLTNAILDLTPSDHAKWVASLHGLRAQFPELYPISRELMSRKLRKECFLALESEIKRYRPYFRPGFDEGFLHWKRLGMADLVKALLRVVR